MSGVADGSFQMSIGSPNALVLTLPAGVPMTAVYTDATKTSVNILCYSIFCYPIFAPALLPFTLNV